MELAVEVDGTILDLNLKKEHLTPSDVPIGELHNNGKLIKKHRLAANTVFLLESSLLLSFVLLLETNSIYQFVFFSF